MNILSKATRTQTRKQLLCSPSIHIYVCNMQWKSQRQWMPKCFLSKSKDPAKQVLLKSTHHAFLHTVAGKSTISGSSGKGCWHNENHNQEKIWKLHRPHFFPPLLWTGLQLEDQPHRTTQVSRGPTITCVQARGVCRFDGLGLQAGDSLHNFCGSNQPTCSLPPPARLLLQNCSATQHWQETHCTTSVAAEGGEQPTQPSTRAPAPSKLPLLPNTFLLLHKWGIIC